MPAKKKAAAKKTTTKKAVKKVTKKAAKIPEVRELAPEPVEMRHDVPTKECEHCLGTGKCTAGEPYDKGHHQMFGSKVLLTSCHICLEAAGEHANSKKLVQCSYCKGTGQVEA